MSPCGVCVSPPNEIMLLKIVSENKNENGAVATKIVAAANTEQKENSIFHKRDWSNEQVQCTLSLLYAWVKLRYRTVHEYSIYGSTKLLQE